MTHLQRAEELLSKITPGEWDSFYYQQIWSILGKQDGIWVARGISIANDAEFIASAPALMRELVEQIKKEIILVNGIDKENDFLIKENLKLTQQIEELKQLLVNAGESCQVAGNELVKIGDDGIKICEQNEAMRKRIAQLESLLRLMLTHLDDDGYPEAETVDRLFNEIRAALGEKSAIADKCATSHKPATADKREAE